MVLPAVLKQEMATQLIDWHCNNVMLLHYTEKGGFIELQRVTITTTGVELIDNSDKNSIQPMLYSSEEATTFEMGSIEQNQPLQNTIILHLEQTAGPGKH